MSRVHWIVALGSIAVVAMLFVGGVHCLQPGGGASGAQDAGCAYTRYIVYNPGWIGGTMPCLDRPGDGGTWNGSILFSPAEARGAVSQSPEDWGALPPRLQAYCAYSWSGTAPPDVTVLSGKTGGTLASDPGIVSPIDTFTAVGCDSIPNQGATADCSSLWKTVQVAADLSGVPAGKNGVDLVVVDTTPTGGAPDREATSPHGNAVGALAEQIACPTENCPLTVRYQLGMPLKQCGPDYDAGGEYGTLGEIAVAVWAAIDAPGTGRPVMNLSLGWAPIEDAGVIGDAGTGMTPGESAVLDALRYANCRGAIVLAAAGNRASASSLQTGPLYPAAWEAVPAPADCLLYSDAGPSAPPGTSYAPLLYAVGGVDFEDRMLANARSGARPRLVAYGAGVTVPLDGGTSAYSPIMTGSSMATATASGVVAAAWSAMPGATPAEVMALVYDAGVPLDASAEFPASSAPQPVHRVSFCRAIAQACEGQSCAVPACETTRMAPRISVASLNLHSVSVAPREGGPLSAPGSAIDEPWVYPQPNGEGCSFCVMAMDASGNLVLDAVLAAPLTTPAVVVLTDSNGNQTAFSLGVGDDGGVAVGGGEDDAGPTAFQATFDGSTMPAGATLSLVSVGTYDTIFLTPPSSP